MNSHFLGQQSAATIASLAGGGYVIAWQSEGQGDGADIYAQRYDHLGSRVGGEFRLNTTVAQDQTAPQLAALSTGGFIAAWVSAGQDGDAGAIVAQRYDAAGVLIGAETVVNTTSAGNQIAPLVSSLTGGGYVIGWAVADGYGFGESGRVRVFGPDGAAVSEEISVSNWSRHVPTGVLGLQDGGFVLAYGAGYLGVQLARYSASGVKIGDLVTIQTSSPDQSAPGLASLADGGFLMTWGARPGSVGESRETYYQRFDATATAVGPVVTLTIPQAGASEKLDPVATGLADGGFVIAWYNNSNLLGADAYVAQRFDASGARVGELQTILPESRGPLTGADIAPVGAGYVIAGTTGGVGEGQDVRQTLVGNVTGAELTTGADWVGVTGTETFFIAPNTLTAGDVFVGGTGVYRLQLASAGVYDFTGVSARFISSLTGTGGDDTLIIRDPNAAFPLDGAGGTDTLLLSGIYSMSQFSLTGNWTVGAAPGGILTLRIASSSNRSVINGHDGVVVVEATSFTLTEAQRAELFAQGVDQIRGPRGAIYNADGSERVLSQTVFSGSGRAYQDTRVDASGQAQGGYILAYNSVYEMQVHLFDDLGFLRGTYSTAYGSAPQRLDVTGMTDGGFVLAWENRSSATPGSTVMGLRLSADRSTAAAIAINTPAGAENTSPNVVGLDQGGFAVTWTASLGDGSGNGVYTQVFSSAGAAVSGGLRVNTDISGDQNDAASIALPDGGYFVVWVSDGQDDSQRDIHGQHFDASGNKVGGQLRINTTTVADQLEPAIARLNDGGYVVSWTSMGQGGEQGEIVAQRYDASGAVVGGEFAVSVFGAGHQSAASIAALNGGGFVIVWQSMGQDLVSGEAPSLSVIAQEFDAGGAKVGPELLINGGLGTVSGTAYTQYAPSVAARDGGYIVTWIDPANSGSVLARSVTTYDNFILSPFADNYSGSDLESRFYTDATGLSQNDFIRGGLGDDSLILTTAGVLNLAAPSLLQGIETLIGSTGADTILTSAQRLADVTSIEAGDGDDILQMSAAGVLDLSRITFTGLETVAGSTGADTFVINTPNVFAIVDGGEGADTLSVAAAATGQNLALEGGSGQTMQLVSIENLTGSQHADILAGNGLANVLSGGEGSDILYGLDGDDVLIGGGGTAGAPDYLYGGAGNDTYFVASTLTSPLDLVFEGTLFAGSEAGVNDVDSIHSTSQFFWDFYSVGETLQIDNAIDGGAYLVGGKDVAVKTITGSSGTDFISTYGHDARVDAGAGSDAISFSLYGLDESYRGSNTVVMKAASGADYVYDFRSGTDHIDLSAFNFGITGQQVLDQAVNVDNAGTTDDYCYFYLTGAGGVDNFVVFMGLLSNQLQAGDFVT